MAVVNGGGDSPRSGASRLIRRQRILLVVATTAALVSAGGLVASTLVKSPAQLAADHGPPSPSTLTAPVVKEVLTKTIVVRGTVSAGSTLSITPGAAQGAAALVITQVVKRSGDPVNAGDVLVEVSGRPVIALPGKTPAYRDLRPGDSGADISQLQAALDSLGYQVTDAAGTFGPGTKAAISRLYQHLGYSVPTTGGLNGAGDAQRLQQAAQSVTAAQRAVDAATRTASNARAALDAAEAAAPPDQKAVNNAHAALTVAEQSLSYARQDLASARQTQSQLTATTGVDLPLNEFVFVPSFPAQLATLRGDVGAAVSAPLVTLNTGALVVNAVLRQGEQALIKPGLAVQLTAEQLNQQGTGTVTNIGPYRAGGQQQQGQVQREGQGQDQGAQVTGYPLLVTPAPALPSAWLGQDVRLTIQAASTQGPVLVVPVAAISTGQDGTTSVTVLRDSKHRIRVPVTAGLDANGFVEVTPAKSEDLNPGDPVVTG